MTFAQGRGGCFHISGVHAAQARIACLAGKLGISRWRDRGVGLAPSSPFMVGGSAFGAANTMRLRISGAPRRYAGRRILDLGIEQNPCMTAIMRHTRPAASGRYRIAVPPW